MIKNRPLYQLSQLIIAHSMEILREPAVLFWGILFPIFMALGLGLAFTKKADKIGHVVLIESSRTNNPVLERLQQSAAGPDLQYDSQSDRYRLILQDSVLGTLTINFLSEPWEAGITLLKQGKAGLLITVEANQIIYHFDPSNQEARLLHREISDALRPGRKQEAFQTGQVRALTLKGTRYIDFLIPGLMAMGVMMSTMWGLSYGLIEKRSKKLIRRMVATPMHKSYFLFSIITVRTVMNLLEALLLFLFSWLTFGFTLSGNPLALLILFLSGNFAFAGLSIFLSSRTSSTEVGNGLINLVVMPMMIGSGIFFSYHNFPDWLVPVIQKLPLTMLSDGMRSIFLEGAGFPETVSAALVLALSGLVFFTAGLKIYKWH